MSPREYDRKFHGLYSWLLFGTIPVVNASSVAPLGVPAILTATLSTVTLSNPKATLLNIEGGS